MGRYEWNSKYILKTPNVNLAVSVADVKAYIKDIPDSEDDFIEGLIKSATIIIENYTSIDILNKTYTMYLDFFPYPKRYGNRIEENFNCGTIQVKRSELQSIASIKYYIDDVLTTFDNTLYSFTQDNQYSRIYLINDNSQWPSVDSRKQAVEIEFIAGHGADDTEIPEDIKLYIKRLVAWLYENRGDCACVNLCEKGMLSSIIPGVDQLCILEI